MPRRDDINSVLIIGAGPIIIGQACEFDYSGTQACKALKEEGLKVVLINSNPATIMTDSDIADKVFIEPLTVEVVERIIVQENIDAVLPTMGGQTALNLGLALESEGVLEKLGVKMIGATPDVIDKAEDRDRFKKAMDKIGLNTPRSHQVYTVEEAVNKLDFIGIPAIIRPSFTMGGTGGGIANSKEEFIEIVKTGLDASPVNSVLVEQSVLGWKEYEMEVVRDKNDNCIIICSIENIDPMGIHTGDSVTVAPALTLTDKEYQIMRDASLAVLREIGVETGGSNVQFAVNPENGEMIVIEMNPRVSRSSALASKATGFPIAKIAAKLAVGYSLDELDNDITKVTPASFEPTIDYVVTKMPRFTFEKFKSSSSSLNTAMKSVGEAMSIGRSFIESFQKSMCSMELGYTGFDDIDFGFENGEVNKNIIIEELKLLKQDRLLKVAQAYRHGLTEDEIYEATKVDRWFLRQVKTVVDIEADIIKNGLPVDADEFYKLKSLGFSDARLATLTGLAEIEIFNLRHEKNVKPSYKKIDTCAAEFSSNTSYMYSSYPSVNKDSAECEAEVSDKKKVIILGGGPNRIGQGIEFDYCCVHSCFAMRDAGIETIMINCNPETVSTDYDTSDRLYFEPLSKEHVLEIVKKEQENGELIGVVVQFGGQTPLNVASYLEENGVPIIGTSPKSIDLAEDRNRFQELLKMLELKQPVNKIVSSTEQCFEAVKEIGYPVVIRPSYVIGGSAMRTISNDEELLSYMKLFGDVSEENPVLIDGFLQDAIEVDVDALCDGKDVFVAGIMQHIEEAGIHSGDSACSLPPYSLSKEIMEELKRQARILAISLEVKGLMNIQFAIKDNEVYLIEVNPRASRTVPFVSKTINVQLAKLASRIMIGEKIADFKLVEKELDFYSVKECVFPFNRFDNCDIILGPEMKSTGEVMGCDVDFDSAFLKSQIASGVNLPTSGNVFISVKDTDKEKIIDFAKSISETGFKIFATSGTSEFLTSCGVAVTKVNKVNENVEDNIVGMINNGSIDLVINTTFGEKSVEDSKEIRQATLKNKIAYYTTVNGSNACLGAIKKLINGGMIVKSIYDY